MSAAVALLYPADALAMDIVTYGTFAEMVTLAANVTLQAASGLRRISTPLGKAMPETLPVRASPASL